VKVEREIEIAAPPDRVYEVVMDPRCLEEWVTIHHELREAPDGDLRKGSRLVQRLKLAGQRFNVRWKVTENERPKSVHWEGRGPARTKARVRYSFEETDEGGTRFSYLNEYELPGGAAGKVAGKAVSGVAGRETEKSLERLKRFIEG
jgi:uncharacterized protein YndB with AHSA1/START domain